MGWFDEEDSSDEEEPKKAAFLSSNELAAKNDGEQEEEDPLEAYMKSLGNPAASTTSAAANSTGNTSAAKPKPGRLDLDNEEEATSHWNTAHDDYMPPPPAASKNNSQNDDDNEVDEDGFLKGSALAKRKLQQTFHKAGAYDNNTQQQDDNDHDDHEEEDDLSRRKRSKHVDIQLDQVDHQQMQYEKFEKVFWKPSSTTASQQDQAWRQEHSITVNSQSHHHQTITIPPIHEFQQLNTVMDQALLQHISKSGYHHPTPVQAQTLAVALGGHDALITAPTGESHTPKTLCILSYNRDVNQRLLTFVCVPLEQ